MGSFWKNVITFGAHGRIEKEKEFYETLVAQVKELNDKMEKRKSEINGILLYVVDVKKRAIISLSRIKKLTKNIKVRDRKIINLQINNNKEEVVIDKIEASLDLGLAAINASKGVGAGLATATSSYFLVGQFAAASTGTAISTLSGAAATNATLAWLGGGSIAAGGGGVAAGTAVMGGIIAIPALAVMGILSHFSANKEIKKIKEKEEEAYKIMGQIKGNLLAFDLLEKRGEEIVRGIEKSMEVFDSEFKKVYKFIYPIPIISKLFKKIKKYFGSDYFNESELEQIDYILKILFDSLKMVDTKVIE
jgi:hypothetical protein